MTIKFSRILITFFILIAGLWGMLALGQHISGKEIVKKDEVINQLKFEIAKLEIDKKDLISQVSAGKQQADDLQKVSNEAQKVADAAMAKVAALKKQLSNLPKPKPPVDPSKLPTDQKGLIQSFQHAGFIAYPLQEMKAIAFTPEHARPLLATALDGKAYPGALKQIDLLQNECKDLEGALNAKDLQVQSLESKSVALGNALDAAEHALEISEKISTDKDGIIKELQGEKALVESQYSKEKKKKWLFGIGGAALGLLVGLL